MYFPPKAIPDTLQVSVGNKTSAQTKKHVKESTKVFEKLRKLEVLTLVL